MLIFVGVFLITNTDVVNTFVGRSKIWANAGPTYTGIYTTDGFSVNLCYVLLKLCQPFSSPCSPKLLKIQPSYVHAVAADDEDAGRRGIHSKGKQILILQAQVRQKVLNISPSSLSPIYNMIFNAKSCFLYIMYIHVFYCFQVL